MGNTLANALLYDLNWTILFGLIVLPNLRAPRAILLDSYEQGINSRNKSLFFTSTSATILIKISKSFSFKESTIIVIS